MTEIADIEVASIEAAYDASIAKLFNALKDSLTTGSEGYAVSRFTEGLQFVRRARALALKALADHPPE